jgi:hypothetical protein
MLGGAGGFLEAVSKGCRMFGGVGEWAEHNGGSSVI